ncbi:hypothetical protein E1B28_004870 [Marasmius oreades]|uniref:Uncharacterized protein n=1 Tax=Marasmius oreades TaxID=181124 RepID=A0A9P8ADF1_9AGAR|nr:uncharacterized protein E1B28_004870 [Marasmius oreades]KAG7097527.1 hypothetical protein E1B28_004870 [Marasmius oreades]
MVGPGSVAGKAIYRLGKITLKGVEQVAIYRRLSTISSHFPHWDSSNVNGIEQMYIDLLELSRPDMYSKGIRFQALAMILAQIGSRNTRYLLNALTRFPVIEIGHLIADIISHFDPISSSHHADVAKDPILKAYMESSPERVENSIIPFLDFLSQIVTLDEDRCDVVLANGVLDMMLGLYVTDFQDVLAPRDFPRSAMKSSLLEACNSLFMTVLVKGYGSELINKHAVSILWPFRPALEFVTHDTEHRRSKRKVYWDVSSRDYILWRVRTIQDMLFDPSSVFDLDTFLDAVMDCLIFVMSSDEDTSHRGLRCLYIAIARGGHASKPISVATAVHLYLSKGEEGLDVASMLKCIADVLFGLLSPTPRVVELFTFENDPSDRIPDVLRAFIDFFASLARKSEEYHKLITETGIIRIGRERLTMLENANLGFFIF